MIIKANKYSVLFSGVCALILTMGVARYSFTPMIPYMQEQMNMTEGLAGWLAGWNYMGYLTGLFLVWLMRDLKLKDYFYRYSLFLAVFSTAIMGFHDNSLIWYLSRFFGGISTAFGFMLGTGLVFKWLLHHNHTDRSELGIHFAGAGLGIFFSAVVVDIAASELLGNLSWRGQWFALTAFGFILLIPALLLMPLPDEEQIVKAKNIDRAKEPSKKWLTMMTIAYICAGFSNTVNVTFTSVITEYVPLAGKGTIMWVYVGLAAAPAPFIWQKIAGRFGHHAAIRTAFLISIISNLLMSFYTSYTAVVLSSITFGFSFMGIVSLVLTIISKKYKYRATQVMAQLTLGYCIAQIISPIISGMVAEQTGSFTTSLHVISTLMVVGLLCLSVIRDE